MKGFFRLLGEKIEARWPEHTYYIVRGQGEEVIRWADDAGNRFIEAVIYFGSPGIRFSWTDGGARISFGLPLWWTISLSWRLGLLKLRNWWPCLAFYYFEEALWLTYDNARYHAKDRVFCLRLNPVEWRRFWKRLGGWIGIEPAFLSSEELTDDPSNARDVPIPLPESCYLWKVRQETTLVRSWPFPTKRRTGFYFRAYPREEIPLSRDKGSGLVECWINADSLHEATAKLLEKIFRERARNTGDPLWTARR